jgi:hypothetical protein
MGQHCSLFSASIHMGNCAPEESTDNGSVVERHQANSAAPASVNFT